MMAKLRRAGARKWTMAEVKLMKEQFERWKRVGPILEGLAFWEARRKTPAERAEELASLLACQRPGTPNDASGWIAWQKVRERWLAHNEEKRQATIKNSNETLPRLRKRLSSSKNKAGNTVS